MQVNPSKDPVLFGIYSSISLPATHSTLIVVHVVEKDMVGKGELAVLGYAFIVCILLPLQLGPSKHLPLVSPAFGLGLCGRGGVLLSPY